MSDGISETVAEARGWAERWLAGNPRDGFWVTCLARAFIALLAAYESAVREREEAREALGFSELNLDAARLQRDTYLAQRDRARAALRKYGVHEWSCQMATGGDGSPPDDDAPCTCGLDAAKEDA